MNRASRGTRRKPVPVKREVSASSSSPQVSTSDGNASDSGKAEGSNSATLVEDVKEEEHQKGIARD